MARRKQPGRISDMRVKNLCRHAHTIGIQTLRGKHCGHGQLKVNFPQAL
jgi:hypothetical protein